MDDTIAVIGSVNIDIGGYPASALIDGDSNPGRVKLSIGGVGCNIARNLAMLGARVRFLTALGGDPHASMVERALAELGIDMELSLHLPEERTSTYLFIADERGDMRAAVSDMDIYRHQNPDYFARALPELNRCRAVLLDANLSAESIAFLAANVRVPIFADAVSAAKAPRLLPVLGSLDTLKPNRIEAELLSGVRIPKPEDAAAAAERLLETGLKQVFITLGADGAYCADGRERHHLPAFPAHVRNATGAGDAFTAAATWASLHGLSLCAACQMGNAAAAIAAESEETVSPCMGMAAVGQKIATEART